MTAQTCTSGWLKQSIGWEYILKGLKLEIKDKLNWTKFIT